MAETYADMTAATTVGAAPTITAPTTFNYTENGQIDFRGMGFAVSDADAAVSELLTLTFSASDGVFLFTPGTTGVTASTPAGQPTITFRGTLNQLAAFFASSSDGSFGYTNASNAPPPTANLQFTVQDANNNTATRGAVVNITAVNDAPTITAPAAFPASALEQTVLNLKAGGFSVADPDGDVVQTVTLTVGEGVLRATAGATGVTLSGPKDIPPQFLAAPGDPVFEFSQIIVTGTVSQINAFLGSGSNTFAYFNGSDTPSRAVTLTLSTNDGQASASAATTIRIFDVNDAPVVTVATPALNAVEQQFLNLKTAGVTLTDVDSQGSQETLILSVGEGGINASVGTTGATLLAGNNTSSVTLRGTLAQLQAFLAQSSDSVLRYIDASDTPSASTTFTVGLQDSGTPDDAPKSGVGHATISIAAVNDAPTIVANGNYFVPEQQTLGLRGALTIGDVDSGSSSVTVVLSVTEGQLTVNTAGHAVTVNGQGGSAVTLQGTVAEIDAVLRSDPNAGVSFYDPSDAPMANVTLSATINDGGFTGSGGAKTASTSLNIGIGAINDEPDALILGGLVAVEQTPLSLKGKLQVSDPDSGTANVTVTLSVTDGVLTVTTPRNDVAVTGSGTAAVTLVGRVADIAAVLNTDAASVVSYINNSNAPPASVTLSLGINDGGASGSGGALSDLDTEVITITPVNDPPAATAPNDYAVDEQAPLDLKNSGLAVSDPDSASSIVTVTLGVTFGALSVSAGGSGATVTGSGTASVTLTGTVGQINALLTSDTSSTVGYVNNSDAPPASATLTLTINDGGATGGGALTASDTALITINPINDAPVAMAPATPLSASEDGTLSLKNTGFSVSDVDVGSGVVSVSLVVTEGVLTVGAGTSGATVVSGSGTSVVVLSGTLTQINALLNTDANSTVNFTVPSDDPDPSATVVLTVSDNGGTGAGGVLTGSAFSTINITSVNDAPVITATAGTLTATEQTTLGLGGRYTVSDADAQGGDLTLTITVGEGVVNAVAGSSGVDVLSGSGTGSVVLEGTLAELNAFLALTGATGLSYYNGLDAPTSSVALSLILNDEGNTGDTGGVKTATRNESITVTAVNDAPAAVIAADSYTAVEQIGLSLRGQLSVTDPDSAGAQITATLSVQSGILNVAEGTSGAVASGSGTASVTLTGTAAQIQALLNTDSTSSVSYVANLDAPPASTTLTLLVNDGGAAGTGGALTGTDTAVINITPVNDAPEINEPATLAAVEQIALNLKGQFTISDADGPADQETVVLSVDSGVLAATAGDSGATVSAGGASVTIAGTRAQVQAFLGTVSTSTLTYFQPSDTPPAAATLTSSITDAAGGNDAGTTTINITRVNDAPTVAAPSSYGFTEQQSTILSGPGLSIGDVDNQGLNYTATLSVGVGALTIITGGTGAVLSGSTVSGNLTQVNAVLAGASGASITYTNGSDAPPASTTFTVAVDDGGNGGSPAMTGSGSSVINITRVNDAPDANVVPDEYLATSNVPLNLKGTGLSVNDPDSGATPILMTLSVGEGILNVGGGGSGVVIVNGQGTSVVAIRGTIDQLNAFLTTDGTSTLEYVENLPQPSTFTTFTLSINDGGATGGGIGLTDSDSATIRINSMTTQAGSINADSLQGGAGADMISGLEGSDVITGGFGDDVLYGNQQDDVLYGNQGNDVLYGGRDNDVVFGGQGSDILYGNLGDDILQGGAGADTLFGGDGADVFRYILAADSPTSGFDTIVDFSAGLDKLDLRALHTSANDTYTISVADGITYVMVDLGGDTSIDLKVALTGAPAVTSADVLWS